MHVRIDKIPGILHYLTPSLTPACKAGGSGYHFYDGLWYDPAGARTQDLPYEMRANNKACGRVLTDFSVSINNSVH